MNNGLDLMHARLSVRGGVDQHDRMVKDKRETLDRVLLYSYQRARVRKLDSEISELALINPNKVKQDYDDKIISIGYEHGYTPGTVFEWVNTGTKWLIYLQDLTELAYFKGDIRKCSYEISWKDDEDNLHTIYAATRGPVETKIDYLQKEGISLDTPNHTLNLLIPKNKDTLEYFRRYQKFYLKGLEDGDKSICWRIEANDTISTPGILELTAVEYYVNEIEDNIEEGLVGDLIVKPIVPETSGIIEGETFIKPKIFYTYKYTGSDGVKWSYDSKLPIEVKINDNEISIKWKVSYTGQFELSCGNETKTIVVESLF